MALILDGKVVRDQIADTLTKEVSALSGKPTLAIIQVGTLGESTAYIRQKQLFGERIGVAVNLVQFPDFVKESELLSEIQKLNSNSAISGIIVQLPLPKHLDKEKIIEAITPEKDVDGLTSHNVKMLSLGSSHGFIPATTKGIMILLAHYGIPVAGKRVVIVGRSSLVGKPTALAMLSADATVIMCHSKTSKLGELTRQADVIVAAIGKAKFLGKEYFVTGQVVVDVGINLVSGERLEEEVPTRKLVGDVDFEAVSSIVKAISPVPGGVGPMTVAALFENVVTAYKRQQTLR